MKNNNILVPNNVQKLELHSYVIGYKEQGESIVILLKKDSSVIYSIVIDSYEININNTMEILEQNNIKELDVLCWTHPHDDHTKGITKIVAKYCKGQTKILIPNIDINKVSDMSRECRGIYKEILKINRFNRKKQGNLIFGGTNLNICRNEIIWKGSRITFNIECIAPPAINVANNKFNKITRINDYSIALVIEFNGQYFIYSGDIENNTIRYLMENNFLYDKVAFLKAPHHGSNSTSKICNIVNLSTDSVCAVTNYKNGTIKLPENSIINLYKQKTKELYLFNKGKDSDDFGILESTFTIKDANFMDYYNNTIGLVSKIKT